MQWTKRPQLVLHPTLGRRHRWRTKCKRYRIDLSLDIGPSPYLAQAIVEGDKTDLIGRKRTLTAAKTECERHSKKAIANGSSKEN